MTKEQLAVFENRMEECAANGDPESAHGDADQVLCDLLTTLGYKRIVELWEKVEKWYA